MRLSEGLFAAGCAAFCAVMFWCAVGLVEEPFYACGAIFMSAFSGSLAAFVFWGRIEEMARPRNRFRATTILPGRR